MFLLTGCGFWHSFRRSGVSFCFQVVDLNSSYFEYPCSCFQMAEVGPFGWSAVARPLKWWILTPFV